MLLLVERIAAGGDGLRLIRGGEPTTGELGGHDRANVVVDPHVGDGQQAGPAG